MNCPKCKIKMYQTPNSYLCFKCMRNIPMLTRKQGDFTDIVDLGHAYGEWKKTGKV